MENQKSEQVTGTPNKLTRAIGFIGISVTPITRIALIRRCGDCDRSTETEDESLTIRIRVSPLGVPLPHVGGGSAILILVTLFKAEINIQLLPLAENTTKRLVPFLETGEVVFLWEGNVYW